MRLFDSAQTLTPNVISVRPRRYAGEFSRVGVFPYQIKGKMVWQLRPEEEVLDQKSIDSLLDAVITIGHPDDDNDLDVMHGGIYTVHADTENLSVGGEFMVMTEEADGLAKLGSPLSPMYDVDVIETGGVYKGQRYDVVQRNIRYTSLGLVNRARQGDSIRVFYQLSKDSGGVVTTDTGLEYNASIITCDNMKNRFKAADSAATLAKPVESPVIPSAISTATLESLEAEAVAEVPAAVVEVPAAEAVLDETVEIVAEVSEVVEAAEAPEAEVVDELTGSDDVVAQITNEGGVLVNRAYLDEVVETAQAAVTAGIMSLADAIWYGQADLDSVQKAILAHYGIALRETDDVSTAYRVFTHSMKAQAQTAAAIESVTAQTQSEPVRKTIADEYQASQTARTVAAPTFPGANERANAAKRIPIAQQKPMVTHPATTKTTIADSHDVASEAFVSFDSIGL